MMRRIAIAATLAVTLLAAGCGDGDGSGDGTTKVRLGYLNTEAISPPLFVGLQKGIFERHGIDLELVKFDSGPAASQALAAGSVDVVDSGAAVVANFAARGQGKVIAPTFLEYDTNQIWVRGDSGITSVQDLAGKQIALPIGTTAHVLLHTALVENGVDPDSVEVVNTPMGAAASALISGAVPAAALWIPHQFLVEQNLPGARQITSLKDYYPGVAVLGGMVANNDFHKNNRDALKRLITAWLEANDVMLQDQEALRGAWEEAFKAEEPWEQFRKNWETVGYPTSDEWKQHVENGDVAKWIERVEQVMVGIGALDQVYDPNTFFDKELFLDAYEAHRQS